MLQQKHLRLTRLALSLQRDVELRENRAAHSLFCREKVLIKMKWRTAIFFFFFFNKRAIADYATAAGNVW